MITRMDSSISIIAVIYGILNNFSSYLKIINFSRWWSFHYRHSGSSIIIPKEGLKRRRLHNVTADKTILTVKNFLYQFHSSIALHSPATAPENSLDDPQV